jgi:DNA-directed RNA polymerase specialized sigma24 family protein
MTPDRAKKIRAAAMLEARILKLNPTDAEELAQDVVIYFLLNPEKGATIRQAVIDAFRAVYGDSRRTKNPRKIPIKKTKVLTPKAERRIKEPPKTIGVCSLDDLRDILALPLPSRDRAMLILRTVYGFNLQEIAFLFDVSEGGASKIFKEMT